MEAVAILHSHKLRRTSCREGIIEVVMAAGKALSEHEIRERLAGNFDRSTFYRSFKTLEDSNILHRIIIDNQPVKYALGTMIPSNKEHAHFYCRECQTVTCIDGVDLQNYSLPQGYLADETEVIFKGSCADCKEIQGDTE